MQSLMPKNTYFKRETGGALDETFLKKRLPSATCASMRNNDKEEVLRGEAMADTYAGYI